MSATVPYSLDQAEQDIADLRGQIDLLTEVASLTDGGVVPNTPSAPNTFSMYSALGTPSWVNDNGLQMGAVGAQSCWFPGNTVSGTGQGNLAAWSIPAGDPNQFSVYETEVWGNGQQGSTQQAVSFTVVLGGNSMANVTFGTTAFSSAPANAIFRWRAVARAICHTTGTTGTFTSYILATVSVFNQNLSPGNANMANGFSCESTGTTTINTTVANNLGVSASWGGAATGSQNVTSQVAIAKRIC